MTQFSDKKDKQLQEDASTYLVQRWEPTVHKPLVMVKGEGVYMWDAAGKKYLDFMSQLYNVHIGMGNRVPIEAAKKQLDELAYASPSYFNEPQIRLAKKLAQITPGDLCQTFFGNSGTEANEVAIKLAQLYREAPKIIGFWDAYHGSTYAMVSVGGSARNRQFKGLSIFEEFKHIPSPYCYRCPYKKTYPECELLCAEFLRYTIEKEGENTVAAFMAEPICSWAGQVVPPDGYWKRIREICDEKGFPHSYTYSGHAVSCATALAVIDLYEKEKLAERAAKMGAYVMGELRGMMERVPIIGDVRGLGLFMGVELVKDRDTKESLTPKELSPEDKKDPEKNPMQYFTERIKKNGLIVGSSWNTSILRMMPALVITKEQIDEGLTVLEQTFTETLIKFDL